MIRNFIKAALIAAFLNSMPSLYPMVSIHPMVKPGGLTIIYKDSR